MKIHLALALIRLLSWLPLPLLYYLAVIPARLLYLAPWRKNEVIRRNLEIAFPELSLSERKRLHRRNLVEMMRLVLESGAVWRWSAQRLERHLQDGDGWQQVTAAQQRGRGVLLIGAHFGNWEMNALAVSLRGPFVGLYKQPRSQQVDQAVTRSRQRFGSRLVAAGSPAMRTLLRELKSGGTVGLLMDQLPRQGEGIHAPLFGRPALTMSLVQRLAQRTGCSVFLSSAVRLDGGHGWRLSFEPLDAMVADGDALAAATVMNQGLENLIRRRPEQYLWLYKRYALPPEGLADPYSGKKT